MSPERLREITAHYPNLRIALVGDFCLDRYLEIDPARAETSIETSLPVHNVIRIRPQPGAAGTIAANLSALGIGEIVPIGFCGDDGEGFELRRALGGMPGVRLDHFLTTDERATFTYTKPLVLDASAPPRELSRLDIKNWTPTPAVIESHLVESVRAVAGGVDAIIVMDQVDHPETGVVTGAVREALGELSPALPVLVDSRAGLERFAPAIFKLNEAELSRLAQLALPATMEELQSAAVALARRNQRPAFVTLAQRGIIGASPDGRCEHHPALPCRGPIDIVGAGDAVSANLAAALAAEAGAAEAMVLAMLAASVVIHQVGTTGTAAVPDLLSLHHWRVPC